MSGPYRTRESVGALLKTINPRGARNDGGLSEALTSLRELRADIQRGQLDRHLIEVAFDLEEKLDNTQRYDAKKKSQLQTFVAFMFTGAGIVGACGALMSHPSFFGVVALCVVMLLGAFSASSKLLFFAQRERLFASLAETIALSRARHDRVHEAPDTVSTMMSDDEFEAAAPTPVRIAMEEHRLAATRSALDGSAAAVIQKVAEAVAEFQARETSREQTTGVRVDAGVAVSPTKEKDEGDGVDAPRAVAEIAKGKKGSS